MLFERNVVVMAVDLKLRLEGFAMIEHLVKDLQQTRHHDLAVLHRVGLRPLQVFPVRREFRRALDEVSEIRCGEFRQSPQALCRRDVTFGEFLADVARARVQHQPNEVFCIQTNFNEVVAATQRAQLLHRFRFAIVNTFMKLAEVLPAVPVRGFIN